MDRDVKEAIRDEAFDRGYDEGWSDSRRVHNVFIVVVNGAPVLGFRTEDAAEAYKESLAQDEPEALVYSIEVQ